MILLYRFTFSQINQDPTTFFNIRLAQQNIKTTYLCEKSTNGGTILQRLLQTVLCRRQILAHALYKAHRLV